VNTVVYYNINYSTIAYYNSHSKSWRKLPSKSRTKQFTFKNSCSVSLESEICR